MYFKDNQIDKMPNNTTNILSNWCNCNITDSSRFLIGETTVKITDVDFTYGDHALDCLGHKSTKYVLQCNKGIHNFGLPLPDNEDAMSNWEILVIIFGLMVSIVAIVLFLKLRKAKDELERLKSKMNCQPDTTPPVRDVEISMEEVGKNNDQESKGI